MSGVFKSDSGPLSDGYLSRLLARDDFWAFAATVDGRIAGGLTAHTLPLTRAELFEIFIYDIAVRPEYQRRGIGRQLVAVLREQAAIATGNWNPACRRTSGQRSSRIACEHAVRREVS